MCYCRVAICPGGPLSLSLAKGRENGRLLFIPNEKKARTNSLHSTSAFLWRNGKMAWLARFSCCGVALLSPISLRDLHARSLLLPPVNTGKKSVVLASTNKKRRLGGGITAYASAGGRDRRRRLFQSLSQGEKSPGEGGRERGRWLRRREETT